jgi:hypothetical protein
LRISCLDLGACAGTILSHHSKQKIMKTQIIRRLIFTAVALIFVININANNTAASYKFIPSKITIRVFDSADVNAKCIHNLKQTVTTIQATTSGDNSQNLNCYYCTKEHPIAIIPEPNGDHEFQSFHFKHHGKRSSFWKAIAAKTLSIIYFLLVLIAYVPYKIFK